MRPDLKWLILGFIGFFIYAACDSAFAWWMKELVDSIENNQTDRRWQLSGMIVGIFLLRGLGGIGGGYCTEYVARRVVNALRQKMFAHILRLPSNFYKQYSSGSVLSKLIFNIENVASASTNALRIIVRGGLTVIGLLLFMLYINWQLSSIFLIISPIMALIIAVVTKRFRKLSSNIQNAMGNVGERAGEVFRGYEVVKIFDGYEHENRKFAGVVENERIQRLKLVLTNDTSSTLIQIIFALALSTVILIAMQPHILHTMSAGEFVSFVTAAGFISRPILQLTQVNAIIQQGVAAAESVFTVLDLKPEQDQGKQKLKECSGEINFQKVKFCYPDQLINSPINTPPSERKWILNGIDFAIPSGATCALVGRSGSGKTTLAGLLARFYDPTEGDILLDGQSLTNISIHNLRQNIALVNQNISLFNASIAQNIAYGAMQDASRESIIQAAEQAQVMEFVADLPQGLDTQIGESGVMLSGGQRQRIAIARAFLKDAPILILDEATSALDNRSERLIQSAIEKLMKGRTSVIIAHRLSTIEKADLIVVLDEGRIVESGQHLELLQKEGAYADMYFQSNETNT